MKSEVYKRRLDTRDELIALILVAAARKEKRKDQLKTNKTRSSHTSRESALRLMAGGFLDIILNCNKFVIPV